MQLQTMTTSSTTTPRVVFLDSAALAGPGDLNWEPLTIGTHFTEYPRTAPEDILSRVGDAQILITNKCQLTAELLQAMPNVRLILEAATGYDNIDTIAARRCGIDVCNVAGYARMPVAQTIVSYLLHHCNRIATYAAESREGRWTACKDFCLLAHPTLELEGKRITIVGLGSIGNTLAEMLRPFGVELCAVTSKPQEELPPYITKIDIEEAFATSFAVSLNCPLTPSTKEFVDERLLSHAHDQLILINTARGGVVNEHHVAQALEAGRLGAYYADVLSAEPPTADNPLLRAPRSFITPHIAWATREARTRIIEALAYNIRAFTHQQPLRNVVN